MGVGDLPIGGLPANQRRAAERANARADSEELTRKATDSQKRRWWAARTSTAARARSPHTGVPGIGGLPAVLGAVLGRSR